MKNIIVLIIIIIVVIAIFKDDKKQDVLTPLTPQKVVKKTEVKVKPKVIEKTEVKVKPKVIKKVEVKKDTSIKIKKIEIFSGSDMGDQLGKLKNAKYNYPTKIMNYGENLYLIDEANNKIKIIKKNIVKEIILHEKNNFTKKMKPIKINKISSLAIMNDKLIVIDYWKSQIYKFTLDGMFLSKYNIDYDNKLNKPMDITYSDNQLYIADTFNNKIKIIKNDILRTYAGNNKFGSMDGNLNIATFNKPSKIMLINDKFFILDSATNKIRIIEDDKVNTLKFNVTSFTVNKNNLYAYDNKTDNLTLYNFNNHKIIIFKKKINLGDISDMCVYKDNLLVSISENHKIYKIVIDK